MAKYHIGKNGKPARCSAKPGNCPRGSESSHYSSPEAAAIAAEKHGMKYALRSKYSKRTSIKTDNISETGVPGKVAVFGKVYNEHQAQALVDSRKTLGKFIQVRAFSGDLSENINRTSAAVKRMNKLGDFAMARGDKYAMEKLEGAVLADKMHFKQKDGTIVSVNDALRASADYKTWDDGNKLATARLSALAQDPEIEPGAYKYEGVSVTVKDGEINENYAKELDDETLAAISEVKSTPDINLAKSNLSPERLNQVLSFETVAEVMDGRMDENRSAGVKPYEPNDSGESKQEQFHNIASSYGGYVKEMQTNFNSGKTAIKTQRDNVTKIVKEEADSINEKLVQNSEPNKFGYSVEEKTGSGARNIVFGGRKMDTGILVSGRNRLSRDTKDILSPEELDAISVKKPVISKEKAQEVLNAEQFGKLFSARKVSLREASYRAKK